MTRLTGRTYRRGPSPASYRGRSRDRRRVGAANRGLRPTPAAPSGASSWHDNATPPATTNLIIAEPPDRHRDVHAGEGRRPRPHRRSWSAGSPTVGFVAARTGSRCPPAPRRATRAPRLPGTTPRTGSRRRLRHARRAGEPQRPALAADRRAGHPHQGPLAIARVSRSSASKAAPGSPTWRSPRRAGTTSTTTSSSSATAASTARRCSTAPRSTSALKHSADFLAKSSQRRTPTRSAPAPTGSSAAASTSPATRCRSGSTTSRRPAGALGYGRIDLLSESAGTRTAMVYSWRHPDSINRSVMVGANPPGNFLWDPSATDEQIARYADAVREGQLAAATAPAT